MTRRFAVLRRYDSGRSIFEIDRETPASFFVKPLEGGYVSRRNKAEMREVTAAELAALVEVFEPLHESLKAYRLEVGTEQRRRVAELDLILQGGKP